MGRATLTDIKGKELSELETKTNTEDTINDSNRAKETKTNTKDTNSVSNSNESGNTASSDGRGRKSRRRQRKTPPPPAAIVVSPIQRLFDTCKDVFALSGTGIVPTPDKIDKLRAVLDQIQPADVGLTPRMSFFRQQVTQRAPAITYLHIHECEKFSMGIFCLPRFGVIPLHNHPGMTVFSKLLFGTMHIKSYDWAVDVPSNASAVVDPSQSEKSKHPEIRLAKVKVDSKFKAPCNTSILYPADGGNMHCFTAVTACAVLDVLGPPYSDPEGRHCTYYFDHPFTKYSVEGLTIPEVEKDKYAWLQERKNLEGLAVVGAFYPGPKIVKK